MKYWLEIQLFGGRGAMSSGGGGGSDAAGGAAEADDGGSPEMPGEIREFDPMTATLDELYAMEYKTFSDKPKSGFDGGWEYAGSGKEQQDFFSEHSNVDELADGLNDRQREAFRYWARGGFMDGAQYGGWDAMSTSEHHMTSRMDHVIDRATLDQSIVVSRLSDAQLVLGAGRKRATLEEMRAMEGSTIMSKGAMSCGAASQGLTIGSTKPIEYKIHIVGGESAKGAGLWIGDSRINPGWGAKQREYVMNRDTNYRVGRSSYDSKRGVIVTDLFYIGRSAHDYGSKSSK